MFHVLSILDRKASEFGGLYLVRNLEVGVRMFSDSLSSGQNNLIAAHPEDFSLVEVGAFDEETGALSGIDGFEDYRLVIEAAEVLRRISDRDVPELSDPDRKVSDGVS